MHHIRRHPAGNMDSTLNSFESQNAVVHVDVRLAGSEYVIAHDNVSVVGSNEKPDLDWDMLYRVHVAEIDRDGKAFRNDGIA
jgi:hypothetical protein